MEPEPEAGEAVAGDELSAEVRAALEKAAAFFGLGRYPSTLEAVFDRGPRLHNVYVKSKIAASELDPG